MKAVEPASMGGARKATLRAFAESDRRGRANANFQVARAELQKLGVSLWMRPQPRRYFVKLDGTPDRHARAATKLCDAVDLAIAMAKHRPTGRRNRKA